MFQGGLLKGFKWSLYQLVQEDWASWADTMGSGWTMSPGPKTKACWATLEQSGQFYCTGSPATSPLLCPRWRPMGRHIGPDPPMADWVHPQPRPVGLEPVKQAISAHERALCQLTVCFEFQSRSETRKGHKSYALQMAFRSKVQIQL